VFQNGRYNPILFLRNLRFLGKRFNGPYQPKTTWFQGLFISYYGCFSAFCHHTSALSDLDPYLGLGVIVPRFPARYPTNGTPDTCNQPSAFPIRGFHPLRRCFPAAFGHAVRPCAGPNSTSPFHFWTDSVCPVPFSVAPTKGITVVFFSFG
jgi:hypothetical protein